MEARVVARGSSQLLQNLTMSHKLLRCNFTENLVQHDSLDSCIFSEIAETEAFAANHACHCW
jgi:hypothetical protein